MRKIIGGALTLVAAGAIGGGFALAMSQDQPRQPVELRHVVETATSTPTATTSTAAATSSPSRPASATTAPHTATVAPSPAATTTSSTPRVQATPHVVRTSSSAPQPTVTHPPVIPPKTGPVDGGHTATATR